MTLPLRPVRLRSHAVTLSRRARRLILLAACATLAAGPAYAQDVGGDLGGFIPG